MRSFVDHGTVTGLLYVIGRADRLFRHVHRRKLTLPQLSDVGSLRTTANHKRSARPPRQTSLGYTR